MEMKTLGIVMGAMVLLCLTAPAGAEPRDSVDRGDRMDRDAIRDDVRIDRLKVPAHPLSAEQPPTQQQPVSTPKAKPKSKKSGDVR